jgi:hypothetical protein
MDINKPTPEPLKPCLGSECQTRSGHVLWCEHHPNYPHDGPDPYYQKILDKENNTRTTTQKED